MPDRLKSGAQRIILVLIVVSIISCVPIEKLRYLNDIDEIQEPYINPRGQKLIMPFDKINIGVFSIDEKTNLLFNSKANVPDASSSSAIGYVVDVAGNINYPFIGKVNVSGLTPEQAGIKLGKALSDYVTSASVTVNFLESRVTIMGDVNGQGVYSFNQDKLTIYEALALGGGISNFGDRKNVILIRQEGDKIMHHKLDLTDSRIAGKDYYYIQANDVIVVEPMKLSSWYNFNSGNFATIMGTFTTLLIIYTFMFQK